MGEGEGGGGRIVRLDHARVEDLFVQVMGDCLAMARICHNMAGKIDMVLAEMREAMATGEVVPDRCAEQVRGLRKDLVKASQGLPGG